MVKLDKRRKYFMVLDCETATLPFIDKYTGRARKTISIMKPLIYDLGYTIIDKKGNVYLRRNFLITEVFSVPAIFNTAYYVSKRSLYIEKLRNKEIELSTWENAVSVLMNDLQYVAAVGAYNAMFDFKKALPFTDVYIKYLYSERFQEWLDYQEEKCNKIANGQVNETPKKINTNVFSFRDKVIPLFDLWGLSCNHLINTPDYKENCIKNKWETASKKYFPTTAEATFRYCFNDYDFNESHTALDDAEIESKIFALIMKKTKGKVPCGIEFFPFRILGTVEMFRQNT